MTPPDFSVLLLAWDDADPQVAVLGGSALPPTLPLVYQLAAEHPVLALYPHLPAEAAPPPPPADEPPAAPITPAPAAAKELAAPAPATTEAPTDPAAPTNEPPLPAATAQPTSAPPSARIIGLTDSAPADQPQLLALPAQSIIAHPAAAPLPNPARSQWPTGINAPVFASQWQAPAAPYLGAGPATVFAPPPRQAPPRRATPRPPQATAAGPAAAPQPSPETQAPGPRQLPQPAPPTRAGDLRFDPDPALPAMAIQQPALFDERTEEVGAAEANAIAAPADDLVPDAPALADAPPAPVAPDPAPVTPTPHMPQLEGLNFRMIQYARQAAQLVRRDQDFGVIYAPNWPAWLAALEIRNSSRQPLVLYLTGLALDFAGSAERGWLPELERMTLRRATLVLVPDAATRQRLSAVYGEATAEVRQVAADDEAAIQRILAETARG